MTMTDPVADFLTRIRNGYQAKKRVVNAPYSRIKEELGKILVKEGFAKKLEVEGERPSEKKLVLSLKYQGGEPVLTGIKRLSKPGVRLYARVSRMPRVRWGLGVVILSTPKGLLTAKQAKKQKVGGEIICEVW